MATYAQVPVRFEASIISNPPANPIDDNTGQPIAFWRAQAVRMDVGIFQPNQACVDLSNLSYLQIVIQETPDALVAVASKTVLAANIIPVITRQDWLANIAQQASFVFSNSELDLSLNAQTDLPYWIILQGKTAAGANIIYAAGWCTVYNPGGGLPVPTFGVVSCNEQTSGGGDISILPSAVIHIEQITVTGVPETRKCPVSTIGMQDGARCTLRFILPATAGIIHQIYDGTINGTLLYAIQSQGDGFLPAVIASLWFDGANWNRESLIMPANGQQN